VVQAMLDKQDIHDLLVRYCRAIDQVERRDGTWRIARRHGSGFAHVGLHAHLSLDH
jgi:hypothetical protein